MVSTICPSRLSFIFRCFPFPTSVQDTTDADFNTDFHEAIAMVPGMGDDKKNKVIDCVQTGYMINDKVIRHAKVAVGQ